VTESEKRRFDHRKYRPAARPRLTGRRWPDQALDRAPLWASVDLRDGNQALLEPMSVAQKRELWDLLVRIGVKQIEVGFPAASQPDYDFVRWLVEGDRIPDDVTVQVLVQAREDLVARTFESLRGARRAIVHVYNSTSTVQRERVFARDRDGVKAIAVAGAQMLQSHAACHPDTDWTFQYSPESFSDTEWDYAVEVCDAVTAVWQPTAERPCIINLPATVESSTPNVFADQVEYFCTHVARRDGIIVSLHTHNDRGTAVAAAELGLMAGADRVEGTLLGNGERTGNMDLVTLAMNLYSQGVDPELDLSEPDQLVSTYTRCTGMPVHPRHPWIGELVYTAFSGSHQDAIRKCLQRQVDGEPWQVAYLPIDPRDLGRDYQAVIRVNSQSGKGGIAFVLERDYGLSLPRWLQIELAQLVQRETETRSGEMDSASIHALFMRHFVDRPEPVTLTGYRLDRSDGIDTIAAVIDDDGQKVQLAGRGEGAIEAFLDAWNRHFGCRVNVIDYSEHAIGEGTTAEAAAYTLLNVDGQRSAGAAINRDTVSASLGALLTALNRSHALRRAA
jgi:2-isopropylmalate synthase